MVAMVVAVMTVVTVAAPMPGMIVMMTVVVTLGVAVMVVG